MEEVKKSNIHVELMVHNLQQNMQRTIEFLLQKFIKYRFVYFIIHDYNCMMIQNMMYSF